MLIDEIITMLSDEQKSLSGALLKTKVLLHKIDNKDLVSWVNNELNGYPDGSDVPEYRLLNSHVVANFSNLAVRYNHHPIPVGHLKPDELETLQKSRMWQSLASLEQMVSVNDGQKIVREMPPESYRYLGKGLHNSFHIERAWCEIAVHEITGIFVHVRSRLLDFLLELRDTVGDDATEAELKEKSASVDTRSMFNNAIFGAGSNTTILVGDQSSIKSRQTIGGAELADGVRKLIEQLESVLPASNLPKDVQQQSQVALAELSAAVAERVPDVSRLRRGLETLREIMTDAAGHLVASGVLAAIAHLLGTTPVH
jgi:uncharacterized coiled-coil protein SlyX